jgi:quinol-cytochrome oxidoreductase complex cytochrome b subunit
MHAMEQYVFMVVMAHMLRSLYLGHIIALEKLYGIGVLILFLMIATAFMGFTFFGQQKLIN